MTSASTATVQSHHIRILRQCFLNPREKHLHLPLHRPSGKAVVNCSCGVTFLATAVHAFAPSASPPPVRPLTLVLDPRRQCTTPYRFADLRHQRSFYHIKLFELCLVVSLPSLFEVLELEALVPSRVASGCPFNSLIIKLWLVTERKDRRLFQRLRVRFVGAPGEGRSQVSPLHLHMTAVVDCIQVFQIFFTLLTPSKLQCHALGHALLPFLIRHPLQDLIECCTVFILIIFFSYR